MPLRSMTGFAQVKRQVEGGRGFTFALKSVNHRYLDLHFRMPPETDALEMKLRRLLKEKIARGHVEVMLSQDRVSDDGMALNRELVGGYVQVFRAAAKEFGVCGEPDLNVVFRMPGALDAAAPNGGEAFEEAVLASALEALTSLNRMRDEEGRGTERELRERMSRLRKAAEGMHVHREAVLKNYVERLQARLQELSGMQADPERVLQEAAVLVDRSDIQEELVRLETHIQHFLGVLDAGGETGKKLDFLLQEMNREANTLLSKTSGLAGDALNITQMGLMIKAEIEKSREQVQNIE